MPRRKLLSFDRLFVLFVGLAIIALAAHNLLKERDGLREVYAGEEGGSGQIWLAHRPRPFRSLA